MESYKLKSIAIGQPKEYGKDDNKFVSSYKKDQFFQYCDVDEFGLVGDTQSDKRYHGGIDKAIHFGSNEHLKRFEMDRLSIGCNILVDKIDENDVFVGDIYQIGDVVVEVTQPRQPCFKIGAIFNKEISRYIIKNHACGWYVRVLTDGIIDLVDSMVLKKRVSNYSIKQLSEFLHIPPTDKNIVDEVMKIESLAQSYKDDFLKQINKLKK